MVLFLALLPPVQAGPTTITCGGTYYDDCFDCDTSDPGDSEDDDCTTYSPAACDQPKDLPDRILEFSASDDVWLDFSSSFGADLHMNLYATRGTCTSLMACADWTGGGYTYADGWGGSIYGGVTASGGDTVWLSFDLNGRRSIYADEYLELEYFECCYDLDGDGAYDPTDGDCAYLEAYYSDYVDCDDEDGNNFPLNTESCDDADNDCDGVVDNGLPLYNWYYDGDRDGYGAGTATADCGKPGTNYVSTSGDCVDTDGAIYPGATEICDGKDNDCDGTIDEGATGTYYRDSDGDGYGDASVTSSGCTAPSGYVTDKTDCDDYNDDRNPGETEICDGKDNDCDISVDEGTECTDDDGDGYSEKGGDCDDASTSESPATVEADAGCNGVDDDCDGTTDEGTDCYDDDGDGYTEKGGDCNDGDKDVNPGAAEDYANGVDDDCDGGVDSGAADPDKDGYTSTAGDCEPTRVDTFPGAGELPDGLDNDCDGATDEGTVRYDDDGDGMTEEDGDCNDADDDIFDGADEKDDDRDNDCDGTVDEGSDGTDDDGDGYSELAGDCDDSRPERSPGADEVANGEDDDCDGLTDERLDDLDGDGATEADGDCDDADGWVGPGFPEFCDELDNDCNGQIDDGNACEDSGVVPPATKGCNCDSSATGSAWIGLLALALVRRRRS
jgi:MYXO-CTERM domain-containing protein